MNYQTYFKNAENLISDSILKNATAFNEVYSGVKSGCVSFANKKITHLCDFQLNADFYNGTSINKSSGFNFTLQYSNSNNGYDLMEYVQIRIKFDDYFRLQSESVEFYAWVNDYNSIEAAFLDFESSPIFALLLSQPVATFSIESSEV